MRRTPWVLVAVISAAALLSGCGDVGDPPAAKVGSTTISRATFDDELQTLADNKVFAELADEGGFTLVASDGGINSQVSATWLTSWINQAVVDQQVARRKVKVSEKNRTDAQLAAAGLFGSTEALNAFPRAFRQTVLARQARILALKDSVQASQPKPPLPSVAQLEQLFASAQQQCTTGKVASQIVVDTKEKADAIEAQLAQGADFAALASTDSLDVESGTRGGVFTCVGSQPYQALDPQVRAAIDATPVGMVAAPVQVGDQYAVIKVSNWDVATACPLLEQAYVQQAAGAVYDKFFNRELRRADIWVDPRYGKVRRGGATVTVTPNAAPNPKSDPPSTPSTTAPAGATSP